jgi:hypothetical protein
MNGKTDGMWEMLDTSISQLKRSWKVPLRRSHEIAIQLANESTKPITKPHKKNQEVNIMNINEVFQSNFLKATDLQGRDHTVTIENVGLESIGRE